jgi:amino acid adenylation domain-containing protein
MRGQEIVHPLSKIEPIEPATADNSLLLDMILARAPERPAIEDAQGSVTYGELTARADRLAHHLLALGVRPGDLVGLCLPRSAALVVAALGIFRAGAAYVAIDPAYPDERLRWILEDSAPAVTITDAASLPRLGEATRPVVLGAGGRLDADVPQDPDGELPPPRSGEDLAYVIYTSGSTGRPKGAMVHHAGLLNMVEWHRRAFDVGPEDRCTQFVSPGFDAAVQEIWPVLAAGAAIVVVPDWLRADPIGLRDWLTAAGITVTFLPTVVVETMIGLRWPGDAPLRFMLTGGDALARRPSPGQPFALINGYGVSEASVVSTSVVVGPDGDGPPSIGRAIAGVTIETVDAGLDPVAAGEAGELVIAGVSVGLGYLNRPELTAERFVTDRHGRRLYRTGDQARIDADGEIEFVGRLDDQLSIRGFRVEAGEVAAALNAHPEIEASVAVAAGDSSAARSLVAYLVGPERPTDAEVSAFLARSLPDYMVPSTYVWLDRLPRTEHGKVDRRALPDPARAGRSPVAVAAAVATASEVERTVATLAAELLHLPEVAPDRNFFHLGGHSMVAAQLIARLEDLYGAEVGLRFLFEHPTVAELAAEVERQLAESPGREETPAAAVETEAPLSVAQEAMWYTTRLHPRALTYNETIPIDIDGPLDVDALRAALGELVRRHEPLRTRLPVSGGRPVQVVGEVPEIDLEPVDLTHLGATEAEGEARRLIAEVSRRPYNLRRDLPLRPRLFHLPGGRHRLYLAMHHVAFDGVALVRLLLPDLVALYEDLRAGRAPSPADAAPRYVDYARWEQRWIESPQAERRLAYWVERLAAQPPATVPLDHARPEEHELGAGAVALSLDLGLVAQLREVSEAADATLFQLLAAGWSLLLGREADAEEVVFATAADLRQRHEFESVFGCCLTPLVLKLEVVATIPFTELIGRTRDELLDGLDRIVPFERVARRLPPLPAGAGNPVFQAMIVLEPKVESPDPAWTLRMIDPDLIDAVGTFKLDLELQLHEQDDGGLIGQLIFDRDLFERATAERLVERLLSIYAAVAADPEQPVGEID